MPDQTKRAAHKPGSGPVKWKHWLPPGLSVDQPARKHFGPGPHPNGSPQSVHGDVQPGTRAGLAGMVSHALKIGPGLRTALDKFEKSVMGADHEHGVFLDQYGNTLFANTSRRDNPLRIDFTIPESVYLRLVAGNSVFTHNHPVVLKDGVELDDLSLSVDDVIAASQANLAEIRAITSKNIYSLRRPASGWPPKKEIAQMADEIERRQIEVLLRKNAHPSQTIEQILGVINQQLPGRLMHELARKLGASYSRQQHAYSRH